MVFLKRFLRGSTATILKLFLAGLATAAAIVLPLSNSESIKSALAQNDVYKKVISSVINDNAQQYTDPASGLDAATFRNAATAAFTPQLLQKLTENFIDGTYHWLQGKTSQPDFSLDVAEAKQAFATGLSTQAKVRLGALPTCTLAQLRTIDPNRVNAYTLPCRPPGLNIDSTAQQLVDQVLGDQEFLPNHNLTVNDLPKNQQGQTAFDQLSIVPTIYQLLKPGLLILGVLSLITMLCLIALHDERRAGVRQVGMILLGTGIFLAISTLIYILVFNNANTSAKNSEGVQPLIFAATHALFDAFNRILFIFAAVYSASGSLMLYLGRKQPVAAAKK